MSKYREIVYLIQDELKVHSDDAKFTEDHIIFLATKYRTFLLKQRYSDIRRSIPESNYQTICLELIQVPAIAGEPCEGGVYLRSKEKVPPTINIGANKVFPIDFFQGEISLVSRERLRYVGYNRFLQNIIYCAIGPDGYLYFKSSNPQHLYLEKVKMTCIFEDADKVSELVCTDEGESVECDILDREFPLEEALIPTLVELIVKELAPSITSQEDTENNAKEDLAQSR